MIMNFQEKLQLLRKENGYSQEELAEKIGISRQAVAKWELGQTYPDVDNLISISNLFQVSIDRLLKPDTDCNLQMKKDGKVMKADLADFLCNAKKNTYAAGKEAETVSIKPGSHDLKFSRGDYQYFDTYYGGEKFIGEEAVWYHEKPVYSMNYSGRVLGEGFSGEFLKEALLLVPKEYPFRGPMVYHNGDYSYHCNVNGDLEWFQGYEEIYLNNTKIYECYFHGGSIR
jgi:transcriptional regulator with XRE-family HTH domain